MGQVPRGLRIVGVSDTTEHRSVRETLEGCRCRGMQGNAFSPLELRLGQTSPCYTRLMMCSSFLCPLDFPLFLQSGMSYSPISTSSYPEVIPWFTTICLPPVFPYHGFTFPLNKQCAHPSSQGIVTQTFWHLQSGDHTMSLRQTVLHQPLWSWYLGTIAFALYPLVCFVLQFLKEDMNINMLCALIYYRKNVFYLKDWKKFHLFMIDNAM